MSYKCVRCERTFKTEGGLTSHINLSTLPCDLFCNKCGVKQTSKSAYTRHLKKSCKLNHQMLIQKHVTNSGIINNGNNNINNNINNQIILNVGDINTQMLRMKGFTPIEYEQADLVKIHQSSLNALFIKHVTKMYLENDVNANKTLLSKIIQLFHSNVETPENINIIDSADSSDFNKVHNGISLIDDLMPKNIRKKRMLQLIINQLEYYITISQGIVVNGVLEFIKKDFIPFIKSVYTHDEMSSEFQHYFKTNNEIIKLIDMADIPSSSPISDRERVAHFIEYNNINKYLNEEYTINEYNKTNGEIKKIVKNLLL